MRTFLRYAETALNDADIVFSMEITEIFNSSFTTNVVGNIDNRNVFGATMESTRMKLGFAGNVRAVLAVLLQCRTKYNACAHAVLRVHGLPIHHAVGR